MDINEEKVDAIFHEYDNLHAEKQVHKQQLRKLELIIFYFSSIVSLVLYIASAPSLLELMKKNAGDAAQNLAENLHLISAVVSVPYIPIICVLMSFAITETFHIYILGNHIGQLEKKVNNILDEEGLLVWESKVCPVAYGGATKKNGKGKITNLVKLNVSFVLAGFAIAISALAFINSIMALTDPARGWGFYLYIAVCGYFITTTIISGRKLQKYVKADSALTHAIVQAHSDWNGKATPPPPSR